MKSLIVLKFGNDVDSIRIVDPETQLSERKLLQVSIIPNVDTQFEGEEKVSLFSFLPDNTIVWIQDQEWCKEKLKDCEEDLELFIKMEEDSRERGAGSLEPGAARQ
jgi:transcription-repair coupling factor (superfamily II helicase)